jgi:hypothetical protein
MATQTHTKDAAAKTAALLAQDAEVKALVQTAGANLTAMREAALAEFDQIGEALGKSAGSLTIVAMKFAKHVADGIMSVGEGKAAKGDDAETVYLRFMGKVNASMPAHSGADRMADASDDAKTPISMFRTFGKAARFHGGDTAFFERVLETHGKCGKDERLSGYNALVKCNRELVKASETSEFKAASPAAVFANVATDEWVLEMCLKVPAKVKDVGAKMADLIAKLDKLADGMEYAGLASPLAGLHTWFDEWKANGCRTVAAQVAFETMTPQGNA